MASGIRFGFRAAVPPDTGGKTVEGSGKNSVHCATEILQTSLKHSLAAEMIRRCNSRSAALPLALDLDPALNLDWVKARSRAGARASGGFGSELVFREKWPVE
jgi:hypothetical protein